jgi:hypothetical protein
MRPPRGAAGRRPGARRPAVVTVHGAGPLKRLLGVPLGDVALVTDATGAASACAVASRTGIDAGNVVVVATPPG